MNGMGKSQWRLEKIAPITVYKFWSRWSTCSWVARWLNNCGVMRPTSPSNSLLKEVTLALRSLFLCYNDSLINLSTNIWRYSIEFGFSWELVFHRSYGGNRMTWFSMLVIGHWTKHTKWYGILCLIMVGLSGTRSPRLEKYSERCLPRCSQWFWLIMVCQSPCWYL